MTLDELASSRKRILSPVAPPDSEPGQVQYEIYHDSLAQAVLAWQSRYEKTQETEAQKREQRRILFVTSILAILLFIALGAVIVAVSQRQRAVTERERAQRAEQEALLLKSEADVRRLEIERLQALEKGHTELAVELERQKKKAQADAELYGRQAKELQDSSVPQRALSSQTEAPHPEAKEVELLKRRIIELEEQIKKSQGTDSEPVRRSGAQPSPATVKPAENAARSPIGLADKETGQASREPERTAATASQPVSLLDS